MEIPRELIYEDRKDINEFGIYDEKSMNHLVYEKWLLYQPDLKPFEPGLPQRRLQVFNDAYYICTIMLMHPTNEDFASYAYKRCFIPSIVFPMVHYYISKVKINDYTYSRMLKDIKTGLKEKGWENSLRDLINNTVNFTGNISSSEFAQRKITPELLSSIKWYETTGGYNKDDILKIVRYIAKDEEEWVMMLDAIKHAARDYEWEYNQNLDYADDEGQWRQDSPKDMSPIYHYCDELKKKYDELSIKHILNSSSDYIEHSVFYDTESLNKKKEEATNEGIVIISDSTYDEKNETLYLNDVQSVVNNKKNKAKKGRPKTKPFDEYLKPNAPERLINVLEDMLRNKNGKEAACIIIAITGFWIEEPSTKSVCNRFPSITSQSYEPAKNRHYGRNRFLNEAKPFDDETLEDIRIKIREKLSIEE